MHRGYIKLWRKFKDSDLWKERREFSKFEAWLDIFTEANHKPNKVVLGNKVIECGRGQCIKSLETWMKRWNWGSKYKVRTFLTLLESLGNIKTENVTITTRITVCNYDIYQDRENTEKTETKRKENGDKTQGKPNNNDNNDKNDKNKYNPLDDCPFFNDPDFKEAWQSWNEVRRKKKCSFADRAIKKAVKKLMGLSGTDKDTAIKILDRSADCGWSDLYPLEKVKKSSLDEFVEGEG